MVARRAGILGFTGYLLLAVALLGHTWFGGDLGQRLAGGGGDPLGFVWFLAWLPHALAQGHSPFFTNALMAPQGANLLDSTSIALPALLFWPITAGLGPILSYDLLATFALCLSAWTAYLALRRIARHRSSAWVGGAVYGFGGYMAGQATAHVNLMIAVFPPLAAMLLDDVRREDRSPVKIGLLLGLCAAAQVFINEEILATTAIVALLALVFLVYTQRPSHAMIVRYLRAGAAALVVFLALAAGALYYQLLGPQHVSGVIVSSGRYVDDLSGFFIPSSVQWLSSAGSRHLTSGFSGADGEYGSYLGLPLIALLLWACWRLRRRALPFALLAICAAILSLGPHLRVLGHDTGVLLPWVIPGHMPLLENAVPARFNLYIWLAVAALIALLLDDLRARAPRGRPWLGIAACVLALIFILPSLAPSEVVQVPAALGDATVFHRLAPGAKTVLVTPSSNGQFAMYAQAKAGFAYSIPEGGVFVPNANGASYGMRQGPLLYALAALAGHRSTRAGRTPIDVACLAALRRDPVLLGPCRSHYLLALHALKVDAVFVCEQGSRSEIRRYARFFTSLLGPAQVVDGAQVFMVRAV